MALYVPYITLRKRVEFDKVRAILNYDIKLDGVVVDYRRLFGNYRQETMNILGMMIDKNPNALILVDPRTDAFQDSRDVRRKRTLKHIFQLAGYGDAEIKVDENFQPDRIRTLLPDMVDKLYQDLKHIPRLAGRSIEALYFIPPYFVAKGHGDPWYLLTLESIRLATRKYGGEKRILAPVAVNEDLLGNDVEMQKIAEDYKALEDVDGYIILPFELDELAEPRAGEAKLLNLARLALELKGTGKFVAVHVAEFGTVLAALGIDAVICGICIRRAPSRFRILGGVGELGRVEEQVYVYSVFRKFYAIRFRRLLDIVPEAYSCACPVCSEYAGYYLDMVEELSMVDYSVHYAYWKNRELREYANNSIKLREALEKAKEYVVKYNREVGEEYFEVEDARYRFFIGSAYLERWLRVLNTFSHSDSEST